MDVPVSDVLQSLRERAPWPVGRRILADIGIARGRGWQNTLQKLGESPKKSEEKIDELVEALKSHQICGEKLVSFFKLDTADIAAVREKLFAIDVPETVFSKYYPATLSEAGLKDAPAGLVLTSVEENEKGIGLIFSSARVTTIREHIDVDALSDGSDTAFDDYEEIIGIKTVRFHAFDVIWIPTSGDTLDVRIDFPEGTLSEIAVAARKLALTQFAKLTGVAMPEPVNVFPLIDKMYSDGTEGTVVELGFGTTTASLKNEKMRRRKMDLRSETYHKGGKAALDTPIEPFKLSIRWHRVIGKKLNSEPELSVNSTSRAAGSANPVLDRVVIRKCMGHEDYEYVRSRIAHHLGS
ncbi:hypothetical protein ACI50E_07145 [Brucella sp. ZJ1_1]|uniref:Uncharacterized protein n=2 Tax=Brucella intermedia TaxID=94625 RepID=C4WIX1_9HYPH|nr:hypothetical protein [Brucella intermedia]EEQ95772.1 Hypothetical protein OINT_1001166 [Brucella intermedia LMG 3301]ELT50865.1 hypothetical protein D584_01945 [Brucella intermedia M86]MCB4917921.1 hypothetical protein [Brucella intermedia]NKB94747.1 hypothetical protein [Brucella intermedia]OOC50524.1 hypothetical protein AS855_08940 [Brucella intermedia M86]